MRALGIDPGLALMGYGLIDSTGDTLTAVDYGVISTSSESAIVDRLSKIYHSLNTLIDQYKPSEVAIESFIARNLRTALAVGQARGVAILAAANNGLPVYDYTPLRVKQQVAGYGRGSKTQIQMMVKILLRLECIPQPDDAADALAIAICHIQESGLSKIIAGEKGE